MSAQQRDEWRLYLGTNPTKLQAMVRSTYKQGSDYDSEDFAFAVEYARPGDIEELTTLKIVTPEERDKIMKAAFPSPKTAVAPKGPVVRTAVADRSQDEGEDEPQAKDQAQPHEIY